MQQDNYLNIHYFYPKITTLMPSIKMTTMNLSNFSCEQEHRQNNESPVVQKDLSPSFSHRNKPLRILSLQ